MLGINITVPIQILLRLTVAAEVSTDAKLPSIQNSSSVTTTQAPILPSGYVAFPEYGVAYKFVGTELNHTAARRMCRNEHGDLALIDSWEKFRKVLDNFSSFNWAWVGLAMGNLFHVHEWRTLDGEATENLPWGPGEPSGPGRCGCLSRAHNGLRNYGCSLQYSYFCEIPLLKN